MTLQPEQVMSPQILAQTHTHHRRCSNGDHIYTGITIVDNLARIPETYVEVEGEKVQSGSDDMINIYKEEKSYINRIGGKNSDGDNNCIYTDSKMT